MSIAGTADGVDMANERSLTTHPKPGTPPVAEGRFTADENDAIGAAFGLAAERHERRRRAGLPAVSTIVGPVALGRRQWRRWLARGDRLTAEAANTSPTDWLAHWVACVTKQSDIYLVAERYLVRKLRRLRGKVPADLHQKTRHELEFVFERGRLVDHGMHADRLCRWLLRRRAAGKPISASDLVRVQREWVKSSDGEVADCFRQLLDLVPAATAAALLVRTDLEHAPADTDVAAAPKQDNVAMIALSLARLVSHVAPLTVALAVSAEAWNRYLAETGDSFAKAVVQENVIRLKGWASDDICRTVTARTGREASEIKPICEELARLGATTPLVESLAAASAAPREQRSSATELEAGSPGSSMLDAAPPTPWKSAQEQFLFQLLEHTADLGDRFQLNGEPGFVFGNQEAEIDLLCSDLKIAVEIDGYYHFTDPEHYRRDRRKDFELQRRGFLVLRFLAEDIVPKMSSILATIRAAVQLRESQFTTNVKESP